MTDLDIEIREALSLPRIPWGHIVKLGGDPEAIAREAREAGDEVLYQRAMRAARRHPKSRGSSTTRRDPAVVRAARLRAKARRADRPSVADLYRARCQRV